ncbi:MAG: flagellar biosynthesis protein FliQ [Armatimonadetes bacterium]|nr:flagellar biosynthesis protein FliQ [Armatimonadota bacterium]
MNPALVQTLVQRSLWTAVEIAAPVLLLALVVGLLVSLFQAATQIQEISLSFIPKTVALGAGLVFFGPWMLSRLVHFAGNLLAGLPQMIR